MLFAGNKPVSFILYKGKLYRVFNKYFDKSTQIEVTVPSENGSMNAGIAKIFLLSSLGDGLHQVDIDWGDATSTTCTVNGIESSDPIVHCYQKPGKYVISIPASIEKLGISQESAENDDNLNPSAFTKILKYGRGLKAFLPYCFRGCSIKEIDLTKSFVKVLEDNCIQGSQHIEKVIIGKTVTDIGENAISENTSLKEIIASKDNFVSSFGSYSFASNPQLTSISNIPVKISQSAKGHVQKSFQLLRQNSDEIPNVEVEIPSGLSSIPVDMFKGCTCLDYISIPAEVSAIYEGAFSDYQEKSYDNYSPLVNGLKSLHINGHLLSDLNNDESETPLFLKKENGEEALLNDIFSATGSIEDIFMDEKTVAECCDGQEAVDILKNAVIRPDIYLTFDKSKNRKKTEEKYFYIKHTPKVSQLDWSKYIEKNEIEDNSNDNIIEAESMIFKASPVVIERQIFDDVEEATKWLCTSAYMDESSHLTGDDGNGNGVFYTWNPECRPTIFRYENGTSEEIFHGQTFKSTDIPIRKASSIVSIEFGKYTTVSIAPSALTAVTNLKSIYVPATVDLIGEKAFFGLSNLETAVFENVYGCTFGKEAFSESGLKSISSNHGKTQHNCLGEDVEFQTFRDWESEKPFYGCEQLKTSIELKNAKKISAKSSLNRTSVKFISYPNAVEFDGNSVFEEMESLRYVKAPKLSAFNSEYMFKISQQDYDIVFDFTEKPNEDSSVITTISPNAFKRNESEDFENFKIVTSRSLYPKWESSSSWSNYCGRLTLVNSDWESDGIIEQHLTPEFIEDFGLNHDNVVFSMKKTGTNSYELNGSVFSRPEGEGNESIYRSEKYGEFKLKNAVNESISVNDYLLFRYVHRNIVPQEFNLYGICTMITHQDQSITYLAHSGTITKSIVTQLNRIGNGIKIVSLDDSITDIEDEAFMSNLTIETFSSGSSVETIGSKAFKGCTNLKRASFGSSLTSIPQEMMYGCTSLVDVLISNSFRGTTGPRAFENCSSLKTFRIPDGMKIIGPQMLKGCISLETLYINGSVEQINEEAFSGCGSLTAIYFPPLFRRFSTTDEVDKTLSQFKECGNLCKIVFDGIQTIPEIVPSDQDVSSLFTDGSMMPDWIEQNNFAFYVPENLYDRWIFMPQWMSMKDRVKTI